MVSGVRRLNKGQPLIDVQAHLFVAAPGAAIKVDRAVALGGYALIAGWMSGGVTMSIQNSKKYILFSRPDVDVSEFDDVKGFLVVIEIQPGEYSFPATVQYRGEEFFSAISCVVDHAELAVTLIEQSSRLTHFGHELILDPEWCKIIYPSIPVASSDQMAGYIEQAKWVFNCGVSVLGWALSRCPGKMWLVTESGNARSVKEAVRFMRTDIVDAFSADYGSHAEMAGFFCAVPAQVLPGQKIALIGELSGQIFKLHEIAVEKAPSSPLGYAKWAFELPIPGCSFMDRIEHHDGRFLDQIIAKTAKGDDHLVEMWTVGNAPATPMISVIVPLYMRSDFIELQLLKFARDSDFTTGFVELIYVIDDPRLFNHLRAESHFLPEFYGVPIRFVFGGRNRGYSGANNLGAKIAKGEYLLFLNSDVFPEEDGWASRMVDALIENPQYGIIGARLLYPSGAIQHLGMRLMYSSQYRVWLNTHDHVGMPPPTGLPELITTPAVTGACLIISKADFDHVEGFDEGYLIADFEDSDLCFKVRKMNKEIGCITDTNLVHLERQSVKYVSHETNFRRNIVMFNAWRHGCKWAEDIKLTTD